MGARRTDRVVACADARKQDIRFAGRDLFHLPIGQIADLRAQLTT